MSQDQQYTLTVHPEDAFLEIVARAEVSFAALLASQEETERLADQQDIGKVLIDARLIREAPSLPELAAFGRGLSSSPILKGLRYALVGVTPSGFQLQILRSVTRNLGFEVNLFEDRDEAMRWLHGEG